jgi:drug/metabolite transporter (DMT)-like permease
MIWPFLVIGTAALQVVRNAAQRDLAARLGVWGAAYVRFIYGLPFALVWTTAIIAWRGWSGGPSLTFAGWVALGAAAQAAATGALVFAMRGRAFAVANVLQKTEVLGSALVGVLLIGDVLAFNDWAGAAIGTAGIALMAHVSVNRAALAAALSGAGAGLLFSFSAVAYRAAAHVWGGDAWVGAACTLSATLAMQTLGGGLFVAALSRQAFAEVLRAWRPSLVPGASGAIASALLFTGFALGPSAAAVKTVQLVDVLIGWGLSAHLRERLAVQEGIGAGLVLAGAIAVLF